MLLTPWFRRKSVNAIATGLLVLSPAAPTFSPDRAISPPSAPPLSATTQLSEVMALIQAAWAAIDQEDWETARRHFQAGLAIAPELDNPLLDLQLLNGLIVVETSLGNYGALRLHAQRFLVLAETHSPNLLAQAHQSVAVAYFYTGEFPQALYHHQQALALATATGDQYTQAIAHANVGETHLALGQTDEALAALTTALELATAFEDDVFVGLVHGNLGKTYAVRADYGRAVFHLEKALVSEQAAGTPLGKAQALNNLGNVYYLAGIFTAAEAALREAIALWESQRLAVRDARLAVQVFDTQLLSYRRCNRRSPDSNSNSRRPFNSSIAS